MEKEKVVEALEPEQNLEKPTNANIDIVEITVEIKKLTQEQKLEEALELCNMDVVKDNACIHSQKVKVLLLMFDVVGNQELLEEALTICNEHAGSDLFDIPRAKIEKKLKKISQPNVTDLLSSGLTNIYCDTISKDEIENIEVNDWQKSLLLLAYYEKNNKKAGISYLKTIKRQYQEDSKKNKILNLINERLVSKKQRIFDVNVYCKYLKCTVDFNLVNHDKKVEEVVIEKEVAEEKTVVPTVVKPVVKHVDKKGPKYISCVGSVGFSRYSQTNNSDRQQKNNSISSNKPIQPRLIKDLFPQEVLEIGTYLYVEMNKINRQHDAIKAWDNFDNLISKSSEDQEAMAKMVSLVNRIKKFGLLPIEENKQSPKTMVKKYNK